IAQQGPGAVHLGHPARDLGARHPDCERAWLSKILGWYVFFAPPKTPPGLIDAWGNELRAVLKLPEVDKRLTELGLDVETSAPAEFSRRTTADFARWKSILDSIGYKLAN